MLSKIRVLDLCDASGSLAGELLAALGADVIAIEPPRRDHADAEPAAHQTGKRRITLDLARTEGQRVFARLLDWVDVLLDTAPPGAFEAMGLDWDAMHAAHPRLVRCTITPFGRTGPYAGHHAGEAEIAALCGSLAQADRAAPLVAHRLAGAEAALAVTMALAARAQSGRGLLADVSIQAVQAGTRLGLDESAHERSAPSGGAAQGPRGVTPLRGTHNQAVYAAAGFSSDEIEKLAAEGVL